MLDPPNTSFFVFSRKSSLNIQSFFEQASTNTSQAILRLGKYRQKWFLPNGSLA
jgi:hypothetical protein